MFVFPIIVEAPPIVYLYTCTSISHTESALDNTCNVKPQVPGCNIVAPGMPLSVANVARTPPAAAPNVILAVCCAAPDETGLHCLYVGVPKALFVSADKFIKYTSPPATPLIPDVPVEPDVPELPDDPLDPEVPELPSPPLAPSKLIVQLLNVPPPTVLVGTPNSKKPVDKLYKITSHS